MAIFSAVVAAITVGDRVRTRDKNDAGVIALAGLTRLMADVLDRGGIFGAGG